MKSLKLVRRSFALVSCLLLAPWPAAAGEPAHRDLDRADLAGFIDGFVEARMASEDVAGVTLSVVHGGAMIFARGYGAADLAAERPVSAERTLFRPGSISKTFTWTAVMQLYEQGRLELDVDIRRYLPNLEIAGNFAEPITLAHLMAHTPGFEDSAMGHLFGDDPDEVMPLLEYLRTHQPARVRPPGLLPAYSNFGVAVAGLIVENVSGMSWEDYVERHLLEPLQMNRSTFREPWGSQRPGAAAPALIEEVSSGYRWHQGAFEAGGFTFIGQIGPAGALSTTAVDMARWMLAHLGGGELDGERILQPDTARLMHRQHFSVDPQMPGMAHGFIESRLHGYRAIGHGGGTVHFVSDMQLVPELGLGIFVSANTSDGGNVLVDGFAAALVERYFTPGPESIGDLPIAAPARPLSDYAGTYLNTRRPYTTVERLFIIPGTTVADAGDGTLLAASPAGETRLEPLGGDRFRSVDTGTMVKFAAADDGRIDLLLMPVPVFVLEKVGPLSNPAVLFGTLAGAGVIMVCAIVGAWLRRRRPPRQSPAEAWAGRILIAAAVAWVGFYGVAAAGVAPISENFANVFFAFPTTLFLISLALGLVAALLTVLSALLLYPVWTERVWPVGRRLRHTGVVLSAVATLLVLRNLNAIGFNFIS